MVKPNRDVVRTESIAADAIRRTWPMASPETVARLVRAGSFVEDAGGTILAQAERPSRVALDTARVIAEPR
jgi:hypothetical protein